MNKDLLNLLTNNGIKENNLQKKFLFYFFVGARSRSSILCRLLPKANTPNVRSPPLQVYIIPLQKIIQSCSLLEQMFDILKPKNKNFFKKSIDNIFNWVYN